MKWKKFSLILGGAIFLASSASAATYKPLPPLKRYNTKFYNCYWINNPKIKALIKELHHYHVNTIIRPYGLRMEFPNYVLFDNLTDQFNPRAIYPIDTLSRLLHQLPSAKIYVIGYSDNVMAESLKKAYSFNRSQKLAGALWTKGIPMKSQSLSYRGLGSRYPVANNRYANHMADNRHVEVAVKLPH
jgi:flagellar motor protein MotB